MKYLFSLITLICLFGFFSCSKSNEMVIASDDSQLVRNYIDEANALINVTGEIDGNVSAIFNVSAVTDKSCEGDDQSVSGGMSEETNLLLNEMMDKMGFESTHDIHYWMVEAGKVLYAIRLENRNNFDSDRDLMLELAYIITPETITRNGTGSCYKDNLVALLLGTLSTGSKYGTINTISEIECTSRGSSFHKIWLFMVNSYNCEDK
jgi:hypothetical protein